MIWWRTWICVYSNFTARRSVTSYGFDPGRRVDRDSCSPLQINLPLPCQDVQFPVFLVGAKPHHPNDEYCTRWHQRDTSTSDAHRHLYLLAYRDLRSTFLLPLDFLQPQAVHQRRYPRRVVALTFFFAGHSDEVRPMPMPTVLPTHGPDNRVV